MESEEGENGIADRDWRSQNFRDGITNQIQEAVIHCASQVNNARDFETRAYSRSSSKAEYIDFVGQVIIRLNVVGNGNRAIEGPREPDFYDLHDDEGIPGGQRNKSRRLVDYSGIQHGANSFETTFVHKVGLGPDRPNMKAASSLNKKEEKPVETETTRDTKGEEKEMKINSERGRMQSGEDDVREYLRRLIREDKEKQIQEGDSDDLEIADLKEKSRAIDKFMDEHMTKPVQPPSYLCDPWSHQLYKDPVVTPSGFTYERSGIEDHLKNVGEYDPISRVKLTADLLIPNHAMRKLVDAYMSGKPSDNSMQPEGNSSKRLRGSEPN